MSLRDNLSKQLDDPQLYNELLLITIGCLIGMLSLLGILWTLLPTIIIIAASALTYRKWKKKQIELPWLDKLLEKKEKPKPPTTTKPVASDATNQAMLELIKQNRDMMQMLREKKNVPYGSLPEQQKASEPAAEPSAAS